MRPSKVYQVIATLLNAKENCNKSLNSEWYKKHSDRIEQIIQDLFPHGSGFDGRMAISEASNEDKIIIETEFHHMNDDGFYDGWTSHNITVRPSLAFGFTLSISGRDRNAIKEYIHSTFEMYLNEEIVFNENLDKYVDAKPFVAASV